MEQEKNRRWMTTPPQRPKWAIVHSLSWPCLASAVLDESAKLIFSRIINDIKIKSFNRETERQTDEDTGKHNHCLVTASLMCAKYVETGGCRWILHHRGFLYSCLDTTSALVS